MLCYFFLQAKAVKRFSLWSRGLGNVYKKQPSGVVDMAAQGGNFLNYSAHGWKSFAAITLAYVLINAFIMLVMTLVERKVRLPGNMGGK